ncbi:G-protein coupled receptor Mth2 [Papilio machaon]|uniref:G-protein coupled receptor Mth2 n=1 Tax=Papilio machaon TaxID=76193 RepID=A0A194QYF6_PAPMA|nr:G-protein coupled receptor Mth2 [Papilio machaon]
MDVKLFGKRNGYLTEDEIVYLEFPNSFRRWIDFDTSHFCIDYVQDVRDGNISEPSTRFFILFDFEYVPESNAFFTTGKKVSIGYAKARSIHRRGENFKFWMYSIYGWGLPLLMTIACAILNEADISDLPWLIKPNIPQNGCFLEGGEKLLYLYVPMLILIASNWVFFLMTTFNIWRLSRGNAVLNSAVASMPSAQRFQRHRFSVYLKLSVIMGINWILEVVSSLKPQLQIWYITDAYNLMIGLAIFIIFVCKAKVNNQLRRMFSDRWSSKGTASGALSRNENSSVTMDSNLSADDTKINLNPQSNWK